MDQDTTLEVTTEVDTVMMIGVTPDTTLDMGMVMTTGDTQVLTLLGRADRHTGLLVTHGPRMFHVLLVLQESQAKPRVARPRVARQHKVKICHNKGSDQFLTRAICTSQKSRLVQ